MIKKLFAILLSVLAMLCLTLTASAAESNIYDPLGNISPESTAELQQTADIIADEYGYFAMFCMPETIGDYEYVSDYAQAIFEEYSDLESGIVFVHNMETNLCDFYVTEEDYAFFSTLVTDKIFDNYNLTDTYYLGAKTFFDTVHATLLAAAPYFEEVVQDTTSEPAQPTTEFEQVERTLPLVVDYADLLSSDEEQYFLAKCEEFTASYATEIAIITITDLEGKTPQEYADDFYDYNGYGYGENEDGILMIYLPGESGQRELHITTHGSAKIQMTGEEVDNILDTLVIYLGGENYYDAFESFIDMSEDAIKPPPALLWPIICVLVGIVIGMLITSKMASANYSVAKKETAADYVRAGTLVVNNANDIFAGSRVITTPKPKSNSDSSSEGGHTSHTSSSGRSHGGGGRSF